MSSIMLGVLIKLSRFFLAGVEVSIGSDPEMLDVVDRERTRYILALTAFSKSSTNFMHDPSMRVYPSDLTSYVVAQRTSQNDLRPLVASVRHFCVQFNLF